MYVYIMKCANYYKIGRSKNPKNRRATIQTHNPLDVEICALLNIENIESLKDVLNGITNVDEFLKSINSKKFYKGFQEFWDLIPLLVEKKEMVLK